LDILGAPIDDSLDADHLCRRWRWFDGDRLASSMNRGEAEDSVVSADIE
jgi:hypothetical protein